MQLPIRFFLKDATSNSHLRLDMLVSKLDLSIRDDLATFLKMHWIALRAIEPFLTANGVLQLLPDWNARTRFAAAKTDLQKLNVLDPMLPKPVFEDDTSIPSLLGILYTLEGSRLGSRLLQQQAGEHCIKSGSAFLQHGSGQKFWPKFLAVLEQHKWDGDDAAHAARAASHVFDFYITAFNMSALEPVL